jgi:hypothetical protein
MMENAPYSMDRYALDESTVHVKNLGDDRAIVAYNVREERKGDGRLRCSRPACFEKQFRRN